MTSLFLDPTKKLHKILFFRVVTKCFVRQADPTNGFVGQITQFYMRKEFFRVSTHWQSLRTIFRRFPATVFFPLKTVLDCFSALIELPENVCKPKRQGIVLSCWQREQNFWLFIVLYRSAIFRSLPNGRKAAKWKILYLAIVFAKTLKKFAECVLSRAEAQLEQKIDISHRFSLSNRSEGRDSQASADRSAGSFTENRANLTSHCFIIASVPIVVVRSELIALQGRLSRSTRFKLIDDDMRRESHDLITGDVLLPGVLQLFIAGIAGITSYHGACFDFKGTVRYRVIANWYASGITATQWEDARNNKKIDFESDECCKR